MKKLLNLYTSNFNRVRYAFKLLIFLVIFCLVNHIIGIQLKGLEENNLFATTKWNEFYKLKNNTLDSVFLGSSHSYRAFDPVIFDKYLNTNSFNMGSPLQKPVESYYVLKEALKYHNLSYVVFDVYWGIFNSEKYFSTKVWNYDCMKFSLNKIEYLLNVFDRSQYLSATMNTLRYHDSLNKLVKSYIVKNNKTSKSLYLSNYKGKGFIIDNTTIDPDKLDEYVDTLKENPLKFNWDNYQLKYLYKIINLCQSNNVKLIFVTAPMNPIYLDAINNYCYKYDVINKKVAEIAKKNDILYIDYNIVNKKVKIVDDSYFSDTNHLNYKGAEKITTDFSKYFLKEKGKNSIN
jgi:hypothetical protein